MNTRLSLFLVLFNCYSISCQFIPPFKTNGPKIVDAKNSEFILKGINWWGINGSHIPYSNDHSKGTNTHGMSFGLHVQQIDTIISAIKKAGFNTIRLPLSNQILHDTTKILAEWVGPNADLIGLTPIEVMDVIVKKLTNQGLFVQPQLIGVVITISMDYGMEKINFTLKQQKIGFLIGKC